MNQSFGFCLPFRFRLGTWTGYNSLVSVSDPWRAFWADMAPFKGPWLTSYVASGTTENQGHSQFCCAGRGGPRKPSKTTDANSDCAFLENALYFTDPLELTKKAWKSKNNPDIIFGSCDVVSCQKYWCDYFWTYRLFWVVWPRLQISNTSRVKF